MGPRELSSILAAAFWMAPSSCCSAVTAAPTARFLIRTLKAIMLMFFDGDTGVQSVRSAAPSALKAPALPRALSPYIPLHDEWVLESHGCM